MKKTHVLFDFDGTLVDSAPAILATFTQVLEAHQLQPRRVIDSRLIGPPLRPTLEALSGQSDPALLDALSASFREIYDGQVCLTTPAYPGWPEVLETLCERGLVLAIATNKRLLPTQRILQAQGWEKYFSAVYASDSHPGLYTDKAGMIGVLMSALGILPGNAIYLGDTEQDGRAAAANAVDFWPVAWGYGSFADELQPLATPQAMVVRLAAGPAR
ncbi:HAD family hydrolase [Pseudomonas nitroreducens]|uniref:HAD family hydrolase n=1 Tax=Pseudomonas nitroreducens TaxID=46680 RepID=UPI0018770C44|nr:HAD family hydrolase [Pseudomonas nitritireducens]